jgi:hypothetical protein
MLAAYELNKVPVLCNKKTVQDYLTIIESQLITAQLVGDAKIELSPPVKVWNEIAYALKGFGYHVTMVNRGNGSENIMIVRWRA